MDAHSINVVALRRAQLLGWVTAYEWVNDLGMLPVT